ncbi:MAG: hypothetical protein WA269_01340 [Candidatus Udaeobacter sp.]
MPIGISFLVAGTNDGSAAGRTKFNVTASLGDAGTTVAFQDRDYLG